MQALEPVLGGDCHFMPEDPSDEVESDAVLCQYLSSRLLEGVAASRAVLLLQTHSAYTDALTLLELYWAIRQKKTIICLRLQDSPYDFSLAERGLQNLETNLWRTSPRTAELVSAWLEENTISFQHMANSLAEYIPAVLTLPVAFSPEASENGIIATLEDIAMRMHSERCCSGLAPVTPKALMPKINSTSRPSLGNVLLKSVQVFSKGSALLHAAAHGERAAHRMSLMLLSATFISAIWRGYVARQRAFHLRAMRDAAILIAWHTREWLKRRRQRMATEAEHEQSEVREQSAGQPGALDWGLSRRRALSRLREARARDERAMQLRRQAMGSSNEVDAYEQDADTAFALLIIASYARCWLGHHATARAARRRRALEEEAAAAALEEERLKKASLEPIAITPELHEAKQQMRNRARVKSSEV